MSEEQNSPVITLVLDDATEDRDTAQSFHCSHCGRIVFEHYGRLRVIIPGYPEMQLAKGQIIQCHGSRMKLESQATVKPVVKNGQVISTEIENKTLTVREKCRARYWVM